MTERLMQSLRDLADQTVIIVPKILVGLMLLIFAIAVAKVVEWVLRAVLKRVKIDNLVEKAGIDKTLVRIGIRQELNQFIPRLVYFLLLLLFARTAADVLGLSAVSNALGSLFGYLPNLVAALLLLLIGSAAAQFIGHTVAQAAEESGIDFAGGLGRLVSGMIMFVIAIMAITQLKIDTDMIRIFTSFALAGMAIAFGLSFGLGSRELMRNIMAGFYARKLFRPGQEVTIAGERGILRAITATHTLVEGHEDTATIANSAILEQVSRQPNERD